MAVTNRSRGSARHPTAARYALVGDVRTHLTEAVSFAERFRAALMRLSDGAPVFSGKDAGGKPLRGHRHGFVLPEANRGGGDISHVTLYAPMGFDAVARSALDRLRRVRSAAGDDRVVLIGIGDPLDFAGTNLRAGHCPLFATAATWRSRTPFVPTRHPKTKRNGEPRLDADGRQVDGPEHELRRWLAGHADADVVDVAPTRDTALADWPVPWTAFDHARRRGDGHRGVAAPCGFRVTFTAPVPGPLALGYGAHFGLGTFAPDGVFE